MYCSPPLSQRMIIGLRAFLLIADSLEKDEGDPPMPMNAGPLPSGGTPRVKTKFLSTTLADETAKKIGIAPFYPTSVDIALTSCLHVHWLAFRPLLSSSTVFDVPCSVSFMHWTRALVALSFAPYPR